MISRIKEIIEYRGMIYSLVQRDQRGRYKRSFLGFLWTFINPLMQMIVYTIVFSVIMRSNIEKYYMFLFVALIPWIFFSGTITGGCVCLSDGAQLIKKIYFPREVLPIAYTISSFLNMLYGFIVIFAVIIVMGYGVNFMALLYLPIIMFIEFMLTLGFALLVSAVTVYFNDLQHILQIVMMSWQFLTPVMYADEMIPDELKPIWNMNPMTSVIKAYRDILYYRQIPHITTLASAAIFAVILLMIGGLVFRILQKRFAEVL